jgi:hypothetical protein
LPGKLFVKILGTKVTIKSNSNSAEVKVNAAFQFQESLNCFNTLGVNYRSMAMQDR